MCEKMYVDDKVSAHHSSSPACSLAVSVQGSHAFARWSDFTIYIHTTTSRFPAVLHRYAVAT